MKNTIFYICLLASILITGKVLAQSQVATPEQISKFYKTKTYVVLEKTPSMMLFDAQVEEVVKKHWDLTTYEFISYDDFKKIKNKKDYSFLILTQLVSKSAKFHSLSLLLGKNTSNVGQMPVLCSIPLSYTDADTDTYNYKLGTIVQFIQNHVELTKSNPSLNSTKILLHYNKNMSSIHNKTLYVVKDELSSDVNSVSKIKSTYKYEVKIVSRDKLAEIIESGDENAVYLHIVRPQRVQQDTKCWKAILGVSDAKLYYFDSHKINYRNPNSFLQKDFKKLQKKD